MPSNHINSYGFCGFWLLRWWLNTESIRMTEHDVSVLVTNWKWKCKTAGMLWMKAIHNRGNELLPLRETSADRRKWLNTTNSHTHRGNFCRGYVYVTSNFDVKYLNLAGTGTMSASIRVRRCRERKEATAIPLSTGILSCKSIELRSSRYFLCFFCSLSLPLALL